MILNRLPFYLFLCILGFLSSYLLGLSGIPKESQSIKLSKLHRKKVSPRGGFLLFESKALKNLNSKWISRYHKKMGTRPDISMKYASKINPIIKPAYDYDPVSLLITQPTTQSNKYFQRGLKKNFSNTT